MNKNINKNNALIYTLVAFILITSTALLINPSKKNKDDLRVVNPPIEENKEEEQEKVGASLKAKSGWEVYKGTIFDIVYPSGFTTQVSDTYEFVKFSSDSLKVAYQVFVPATPKALDKNFEILENEKIETKNSGKTPNCTARICSTDIITIAGDNYKRKTIIRKNSKDQVVTALSVQYPSDQESIISEDFTYFQELFVVKTKN